MLTDGNADGKGECMSVLQLELESCNIYTGGVGLYSVYYIKYLRD